MACEGPEPPLDDESGLADGPEEEHGKAPSTDSGQKGENPVFFFSSREEGESTESTVF